MLVLQGVPAGEIESSEPLSSETVLVVEDTVYLLEVIQLQFQAEGCLLTCCLNVRLNRV